MVIKRTKREVIIKLSPNIDTEDLQKFLNYARYKELTANFKTDSTEVEDLIDQIKKDWNKDNKKIGA
jgi:hypothetical protein